MDGLGGGSHWKQLSQFLLVTLPTAFSKVFAYSSHNCISENLNIPQECDIQRTISPSASLSGVHLLLPHAVLGASACVPHLRIPDKNPGKSVHFSHFSSPFGGNSGRVPSFYGPQVKRTCRLLGLKEQEIRAKVLSKISTAPPVPVK